MIKKKIISVFMAAAVSFSMLGAVSAGASADWSRSDKGICYKDDSTGKKLTGWQEIDGLKYCFDKNGYACTGWKKIGDNKYYFGKDGAMRTGFVKLNGKTYYFGTDGKMRTGKLKISGKTYDFGSDGVLKDNTASASESSTEQTSASNLEKPFKGMKWRMTSDQVIKTGKYKNCVWEDETTLHVYDKTIPMYYNFDDNGRLVGYGYLSNNIKTYKPIFKKYFKDEGWKAIDSAEKDGYNVITYMKGTRFGQIIYNNDQKIIITLMYSKDLADRALAGEFDK